VSLTHPEKKLSARSILVQTLCVALIAGAPFLAFGLAFGLTSGANAQSRPPATAATAAAATVNASANTQGVAAIVNDYVISDYDLDQRTALFIATSGVQVTPESREQIRQQILTNLQDETLQLQEAAKRKITVTKAEIDKAVESVAAENKTTVAEITATLRAAGVSIETLRTQFAAQLAWNKLVQGRYGSSVQVGEEEVDAALARIKEGADRPQYLVSEIFIGVDRPEDDAKSKETADQLLQQINLGAPYPVVARQFSQAPSASTGGDIGWVQQGQLPDTLDKSLTGLRAGQVVGPIRSEGGYYILLLRDRREPVGTVVPEAPQNAGPITLQRILLPLPEKPSNALKEQAVTFASQLRGHITSCSGLPSMVKQIPGAVLMNLGAMRFTDFAKDLGDALSKTEPGGVTPPIISAAGVELIVRCDQPVQRIVPIVIPERDQVAQQLFIQQMTVMARSYLRELKRDAVVEIR